MAARAWSMGGGAAGGAGDAGSGGDEGGCGFMQMHEVDEPRPQFASGLAFMFHLADPLKVRHPAGP
jgi:hypothetical protein